MMLLVALYLQVYYNMYNTSDVCQSLHVIDAFVMWCQLLAVRPRLPKSLGEARPRRITVTIGHQ